MSTTAEEIVAEIDAKMLDLVPAYATHRDAIKAGLFTAIAEGIFGFGGGEGSEGAVSSVNGETGDVVLDATDVGADPAGTAAAAIAAHEAALDPHSGYETTAEGTAKANAAQAAAEATAATALAAHAAAVDPHPGYTTTAEATTLAAAAQAAAEATAAAALSAHAGAADPHTGYQKESEKGASGGYASLDGSTLVPVAQLPAATTSAKGVAELATSAETTAGLVVQASDTRLSDARAPTGPASGDLDGTYPNPTVTRARGLRETSGPSSLVVGAVADGQVLQRSGLTLIGLTLAPFLAFTVGLYDAFAVGPTSYASLSGSLV